jgi:hypothetical protein
VRKSIGSNPDGKSKDIETVDFSNNKKPLREIE